MQSSWGSFLLRFTWQDKQQPAIVYDLQDAAIVLTVQSCNMTAKDHVATFLWFYRQKCDRPCDCSARLLYSLTTLAVSPCLCLFAHTCLVGSREIERDGGRG